MKGNNLDTKFEKLFENYSEEPSSNCWNVVSQKLDVIMPAGSSVASGASSGTSAISKFMVSAVGKSVAILSAVAVVGVSLYAILKNNETTPVSSTPSISTSEKQINGQKTSEKQIVNPFNTANQQDKEEQSAFSDETAASVSKANTQNISEKSTDLFIADNISPISAITPKTAPVQPIATNTDNRNTDESSVDQEKTDNTTEAIQNENVLVEKAPITDQNVAHSNLVFPNVFTPNGDGVNDYFVIKNIESLTQQKLVVVNAKTGQKVFESNNYQNNWDAANAPDGAYYYVLEAKNEGKNQTFYGTVQIIR
jgi:gliding motility-associated-like protein